MKFYVSGEPYERLKNEVSNLNSYKIIDVDYIVETCGLDPDNDVHGYIITSEIKKMIADGFKSKRCHGIVYINTRLNAGLVYSLKNALLQLNGCDIVDISLFDDKQVPKFEYLYKLFDEIVFYNKCKRIKLIECKPIPILKKNVEN